jgi:hypothetical protein
MVATALRVLLGGLAAVAIVAGVLAVRADDRCAAAKDALASARGDAMVAAATRVADRCGDPRDRARADLQLIANGHRADAIALARRMVRDNPDDYIGWVAVYRLTGSRAAYERARALNPRGVQR